MLEIDASVVNAAGVAFVAGIVVGALVVYRQARKYAERAGAVELLLEQWRRIKKHENAILRRTPTPGSADAFADAWLEMDATVAAVEREKAHA